MVNCYIVRKEISQEKPSVDKAETANKGKSSVKKKKAVFVKLKEVDPVISNEGRISLKVEKYKDLPELKRFCKQGAQEFIDKLLPCPGENAEEPEDRDSDY